METLKTCQCKCCLTVKSRLNELDKTIEELDRNTYFWQSMSAKGLIKSLKEVVFAVRNGYYKRF